MFYEVCVNGLKAAEQLVDGNIKLAIPSSDLLLVFMSRPLRVRRAFP